MFSRHVCLPCLATCFGGGELGIYGLCSTGRDYQEDCPDGSPRMQLGVQVRFLVGRWHNRLSTGRLPRSSMSMGRCPMGQAPRVLSGSAFVAMGRDRSAGSASTRRIRVYQTIYSEAGSVLDLSSTTLPMGGVGIPSAAASLASVSAEGRIRQRPCSIW